MQYYICGGNAVLCPVIADGKHSYMDLSAARYSEHVMRPPVSSERWAFTPCTHSHITVSCHTRLCVVFCQFIITLHYIIKLFIVA